MQHLRARADPAVLIFGGAQQLGEPLASALGEDGLIEAVAALRAFDLVDRESIVDEPEPTVTTDCIRLHRLASAKSRQRGEEGPAREHALRVLARAP